MPRVSRCISALVLAGATVLHGESGVSAGSTRSLTLQPELPVRVRVDVGSVRVTGTARTDVALRIERHAPDAAALRTFEEQVVVTPRGLDIAVQSLTHQHDPALSASVTVELPSAQPVADIHLFEGTLRLDALDGPVHATVTRGRIDASGLSGQVRLETVMGNIAVRHDRHALTASLRLRTFNGDIDLSLPAPLPNARILALALNGTVTSVVPLTVRTTVGPRFSEATFGNGTPVVSLDVVNGAIRIAGAAR